MTREFLAQYLDRSGRNRDQGTEEGEHDSDQRLEAGIDDPPLFVRDQRGPDDGGHVR
jgi:hypothetical protein